MSRSLIALAAGALVLAAAPACGDDGGGGSGGGGQGGSTGSSGPDLSGVVYQGGATDEALVELLGLDARDDAAQRGTFAAPADGAVLPADPPATFSWSFPSGGSRRGPPRLLDLERAAPGAAERFATAALERTLVLVPTAHAHGDPVNGRATLVVFAVGADDQLLRVFTGDETYLPDTAAWATLRGAGAPITATLTSAIFESNRIGSDGGPFSGGSITFTIE